MLQLFGKQASADVEVADIAALPVNNLVDQNVELTPIRQLSDIIVEKPELATDHRVIDLGGEATLLVLARQTVTQNAVQQEYARAA